MSLVGLLSMQIVYWIFIHPVNKVWMQGEAVGSLGSGFLQFGRARIQPGARALEWTDLRNQWEYAHAARAVLATLSFIVLVIAS